MDFPKRKPTRLPHFDYSTPGAYFITICTREKRCILSRIVGGGAFDAPQIHLTATGRIVKKHILSGNNIPCVSVDKFVIMPNHVHIILFVEQNNKETTTTQPANALIPHFVSTLKRFCHRDLGTTIFQRSFHDHVIRGQLDYEKIWQYIDNNPTQWKEDCFFRDDTAV